MTDRQKELLRDLVMGKINALRCYPELNPNKPTLLGRIQELEKLLEVLS